MIEAIIICAILWCITSVFMVIMIIFIYREYKSKRWCVGYQGNLYLNICNKLADINGICSKNEIESLVKRRDMFFFDLIFWLIVYKVKYLLGKYPTEARKYNIKCFNVK